MPIKEVTMYRATCDTCGKDDDSEFWAWTDAGQALAEWRDGHSLALDDGRLFCDDNKCIPADVCRYSDGDGKHSPSDDGLTCDECDRRLAPVAAVSAPQDAPETVEQAAHRLDEATDAYRDALARGDR